MGEDSVGNAFAMGRSLWPAVRLSEQDFRKHVEDYAIAALQLEQNGGDIFLAAACARGDVQSLRLFDLTFVSQVPAWLRKYRMATEAVREVQQVLRTNLLASSPAKIADYQGFGPLAAWVRMCAVRISIRLRAQDPGRTEGLEAAVAKIAAGMTPEQLLANQQVHLEIRGVLQHVLAELSSRERALLRTHFLDGLTLDELALTYQVHRATVARWLAAIRRKVLEGFQQELRRAGASTSEQMNSLLRGLGSQLQLSVRRFLETQAP
jgi:RNA polymerase sigma-70 factor (ECF subfamily)